MPFSFYNNLRRLVIGSLAALVVASPGLSIAPVQDHEADCPLCHLKVDQDMAAQDNEVALRYGHKRIEYRCVWCALSEAKTDFLS